MLIGTILQKQALLVIRQTELSWASESIDDQRRRDLAWAFLKCALTKYTVDFHKDVFQKASVKESIVL